MKGTESFKQTIHSYLEQRASEDTLFAEKYHAVNRSIDDIVTYILNEVMKSECHGFDDDEIYSLAIHAAEEKDLEVGKPMECDVKVNHVVELTEEEKQEARRNAIRRLENENLQPHFPTQQAKGKDGTDLHHSATLIIRQLLTEHYETENAISEDGVPVRQGHGTHRQESNQVGSR
jgi:hypothetical protein